MRLSPLAWEILAAPLLMWQGRQVRRWVPKLPAARGEPRGVVWPEAFPGEALPGEEARGAREILPLRLLILGDSAAAGVGVDHLPEAMPGHLAVALACRLQRPVAWQLIAVSGLDARGLLALLEERIAAHPPVFDVALIAVGVNDATGRRPAPRWLEDLHALRNRLLAVSPAARLLWSGLPPMHRFEALPQPLRAYLGERARRLDAALAAWVARHPRMAHLPLPELQGDGMMASDGFHPGALGHRLWGEMLAQAVCAGLHQDR